MSYSQEQRVSPAYLAAFGTPQPGYQAGIPDRFRLKIQSQSLDTPPVSVPDYKSNPSYSNLSQEDKDAIDRAQFEKQYGGMGQAALSDFQTLLDKLTASKISQQESAAREQRPGEYAKGLAQMMRNF